MVLSVLLFGASGCYLPMTGTIVDADNNQPIEGAVVLVEWTKTVGIGFTSTQSYKTAEVLSNKDGKFELPGCLCPTANEPDVTIYKKGYIAWNNKRIFPNYERRNDFLWKNGMIIGVKKYQTHDLHREHVKFIRMAIGASLNLESKMTIYKAFDWEDNMMNLEGK